jgi:O-antigen ligase
MMDMNQTDSAEPFRLPRMSRAKTRAREVKPRWANMLSQIAFAALILLSLAGPWMTNQGDPGLSQLREVGYSTILLATLVAIAPWRHPERLLVVPWPLLAALGWCGLSLIWALEPGVGLRRVLLTAMVLWALFAQVREIGVERAVTILRGLLALLLIANFVAVLVYPAVGIHPASDQDLANNWRGVMGQKNWAGMTCALTVLIFAFDAAAIPIAVRIGFAVAAAFFLIFTQSATSMGVGAAALIFGGLFAWRTQIEGQGRLAPPGWAWVPFGIVAALCIGLALFPAAYLEFLSDQSGMTGRYGIWTALIRAFGDRPLLGFGFGSFWDLGPDGPAAVYGESWVTRLSQGHNGYLDLLVQIGLPGTLLVLFATLVWPLQRLLAGGQHPARVLGAAVMLFCLGHNFTESTLFDRDAIGQVFLMIAIALLWNATAAPVHASAPAERSPAHERRRRSRSSRG